MKSIDRIPTSKLQRASKIVTTGAKVVRILIPVAVIGVGIFYAYKGYSALKGKGGRK